MRTKRVVISAFLATTIACGSVGVSAPALAAPAGDASSISVPTAALATDSKNRLAIAVDGGELKKTGSSVSVVGKDGSVSTLPSVITDESGGTAKLSYDVVSPSSAVVTATPLTPFDKFGNYAQCVISEALSTAVEDAVKGGLAGAVSGGLAGATAGGLIGGSATVWSGPGAVLGAVVAAAPGILAGAAGGAVTGAMGAALPNIATKGITALFTCVPKLFEESTPAPATPTTSAPVPSGS
ncbi:MAG: hypothetical protein ACRCSF_05270 [Mycobacteriaceae bacterium]